VDASPFAVESLLHEVLGLGAQDLLVALEDGLFLLSVEQRAWQEVLRVVNDFLLLLLLVPAT
jgi:hypothetical protein